MPNQLHDYIVSQIQNNIPKELIVNALLQAGYNQNQIDEAFAQLPPQPEVANSNNIATTASKSRSPFVHFVIIFLLGLIVGGGTTYGLVQNLLLKQPSVDTFPSPTPQSNMDCGQYHDIGYLKGLYGKDSDDISELEVTIPEECQEVHDQGYEKGKASAQTQSAQNLDVHRKADLMAISAALYQYASEHNGQLPHEIDQTPQELGTSAGKINLTALLAPYIATIPYDPEIGNAQASGYSVYINENGRLVVEAKSSANPGEKITVIR